MRQTDLPERWKAKLRNYLIAKGSEYETLGCHDFPNGSLLRITFEDESKVEFKYAFVIEAPEFKEIAVFTEHCGYHLFPLYEGIDVAIEQQ
ncbi:hypothetical protein [Hymenobacter metallicola]|uniref:Uncharacterized protein n=1 Tax=Hymenobacter metallicola TaxID=2563114 RepID=A0A4Z0QKX7_9BACT|nr:hypothetical protein [Hymenobacter metallicola]TGE29701.1 hypothetical protein E5K02_09660 [Hymenobacter metallicola]